MLEEGSMNMVNTRRGGEEGGEACPRACRGPSCPTLCLCVPGDGLLFDHLSLYSTALLAAELGISFFPCLCSF